jgi:hypothetical protein
MYGLLNNPMFQSPLHRHHLVVSLLPHPLPTSSRPASTHAAGRDETDAVSTVASESLETGR